MANGSSPPTRPGLSLYANLLDPSNATPGSISSAPVTYSRLNENSQEHDEAAKKQQALAASLRFQPTKRPQVAAQKAKAKAIASKFSAPPPAAAPAPTTNSEIVQNATNEIVAPQLSAPKTTIHDWTATASDDEMNTFYGESKQRGGRKKRKKNKNAEEVIQNWDDIYDPSRPNNYEDYKHSEEKIREVREWKDLLYRHRMKRTESSDYDSDRSDRPLMNKQFAPPPNFDTLASQSPPSPPPAEVQDDSTGDNAYARRLQMTQSHTQPYPDGSATPPPPPPSEQPPAPPPGQISRAPVRYNLPSAPAEIPASEAELQEKLGQGETVLDDSLDQPRSNRPGQAGFAERLLSKYGWSKGQGLGAQGTGIINPLYAKVDKRKKKSDAEGGGFATPTATGKILGGNKSKAGQDEAEGKFGAMSEVVKLESMLSGLDLDEELTRGEGGIMQEIGEECGDKYGSVERVYIHRAQNEMETPVVFVQFVSQLSALRAVNALEGRIFNGNAITARFWPRERFEAGDYA